MYKIFLVNNEKPMNENIFNFLFNYIQDDTKKRIRNIRTKHEADSVLIGEILVKISIMKEFNIEYNDIIFDYNKFGKPRIRKYENVYFNISNSGCWVVCVISDAEVGIDIQKIDDCNMALAERICTLDEFNIIKNSNNQASEFTKIWTQKEATLKMIGTGFSTGNIKECLRQAKTKSCIVDKNYWLSIAYKSDEIVKI